MPYIDLSGYALFGTPIHIEIHTLIDLSGYALFGTPIHI